MKSFLKTVGPVLGLALAITTIAQFVSPVKAEQRNSQAPAVIVFGATEQYVNGYPVSYYIYNVQSSPSAPKLQEQAPFADTLESLMAQGFRIQKSDGWTFIMVRL